MCILATACHSLHPCCFILMQLYVRAVFGWVCIEDQSWSVGTCRDGVEGITGLIKLPVLEQLQTSTQAPLNNNHSKPKY